MIDDCGLWVDEISIFDIAGHLVAELPSPSVTLQKGEGGGSFSRSTGKDGRAQRGRMRELVWTPEESLPSGIYLIKTSCGKAIGKVILLR